MIPCIIIYTNKLPANNAGCANAFIIRIRPDKKGDRGLLEHEKCHVEQWWSTFGLHSVLYLISKKYRQGAEVCAYRAQLQYPPASLDVKRYRDIYSIFIANDYGLPISKGEAVKLLSTANSTEE